MMVKNLQTTLLTKSAFTPYVFVIHFRYDNLNLTHQAHRKLVYVGLALNFKIFILSPYIVSVIKSFKICSNWNSFHNDIENIKSNLTKQVKPSF